MLALYQQLAVLQRSIPRHPCGFQLYGFKDFEGNILQYPDSYQRMPEVNANG